MTNTPNITIFEQLKPFLIQRLSEHTSFTTLTAQEQIKLLENNIDQELAGQNLYVSLTEKSALLKQATQELIFPLRSLQALQEDPSIEEIMINGTTAVYLKRRSSDKSEQSSLKFTQQELEQVIEKILEGSGRRVDKSTPLVDLRLPDGSRVNIIVNPLSVEGPAITIRKFPEEVLLPETLLKHGMFSQEVSTLLKLLIQSKANMIIAGATASGKTTVLNALLHWINQPGKSERVIFIEETAEIRIPSSLGNTVRLETRPANSEGLGEYTIRDLVKNALRMRPDRIIVGEARGGEAFDLLQAMNTGHPGSLTTLHANSAQDAVHRFESLVLLAGFSDLPLQVIQNWISQAIDIVIFIGRNEQQQRVIKEISTLDHGSLTQLVAFKKNKWMINKKSVTTVLKKLAH